MSQGIQNRVSEVLEEALEVMKVTSLSQRLNVSRKTIYRWKNKEVGKFDEDDLETLANELKVRYDWLQFGRGSKYLSEGVKKIESSVNDKGADYKGLDQTISDVESKADSLIRDLQVLKHDLSNLRKDGSDDSG